MPHVDNNRKFVYVHIPKCAGNTVKSVLNIPNHDHSGIAQKYISDYFKFAFVRNPWDRFISAYEYIKGGGWKQNNPDQDWDKPDCDAINSFSSLKEFARNPKVWTGMMHFRPQFNYVTIDKKTDCLDFIGRVENLDNDLKFICDQIGHKYNRLPHINKSKKIHQHYKSYYDDELKNIVATIYSKDIEYFKYTFE